MRAAMMGVCLKCIRAAEPHNAVIGFKEGQEVESPARQLKNIYTKITSDIHHNFLDK
jgi:hypothetical protein